MKKLYVLLILLLFNVHLSNAQTSTELFETEFHNSTSFTDNGVVFNILSHNGFFDILGTFPGTGWNGTANDNKYIDNTGYGSIATNASFSIKTTSNLFKVNSFWVFLSNGNLNQTVSGNLTVTGKLNGVTKFSQKKTSGFATSLGNTNGYTLIDLTNLNGQNYSNITIDELVLTTGGDYTYMGFDAFTWIKDPNVISNPPIINEHPSDKNICTFGNATFSITATYGVTYQWYQNSGSGFTPLTNGGMFLGVNTNTLSISGITGIMDGYRYHCVVTNNTGSVTSQNAILTVSSIEVNAHLTDLLCNGSSSGAIYLNPTGGKTPYSYVWNDGFTSKNRSNLAAGNYSVTVTDAKGCTKTVSYTITEPDPLQIDSNFPNLNLCGPSTVDLEILTPGTVKWYNSETQTTPIFTGNVYSSNVLSSTSLWYSVSTEKQSITTGPLNAQIVSNQQNIWTVEWDVYFTIHENTILKTIDIFPNQSNESGNLQFKRINGSEFFSIASINYTTNGTNGTIKQTIPIDVQLSPGTYLIQSYLPQSGILRNIDGATYPYTSQVASITGNEYNANYYLGYYNWVFETGCETTTPREEVLILVDNTPAPTANDQEFCISEAKTVGDLVINGTDVKWYNTSTATTQLDATELLVSGTYYASQTQNGCESTTRTAIEVTIFETPAPTANDQEFCISEAKTVGDLIANGTDVKWYASSTTTTELDATEILVSGMYYASQTLNGCESTTRTTVEVTIFDTPDPTADNQNYCISEAKTVGDLVINGTDVKWYVSATATTELDTTELLVSGTYYASQTLNGCESTTRTAIEVTIIDTQAPTANDQEFCISEAKTVGDLLINGTDVKWYTSATATTELNATEILVSGTYYASQTINGCESTTRTAIEVTIIDTPSPTATNQEFCISEAKTVGDLVINGTDVKWYASATTTTQLDATEILVSGTYYASQTLNGCESISRAAIEVTIFDTPAPTANNQQYCISEAKTVGDLIANGTDVKWYASSTTTTQLDATEILVSGTYYASQILNGCESTTRAAIEVTIFDTPAPTANDQEFCISEAKTVGDLVINGTDVKWYASATSTVHLDVTDLLVSGTYYVTQTINGCESTTRTAIVVTIFDTPAPTATNQEFCISEGKTVGDLVVNGTGIKWYASATSTTELDATEVLVSGTYYASQTLNDCESTSRTAIEVVINETPIPTGTNAINFCSSEFATLEQINIVGENIQWYASPTSTQPLDNTTVVQSQIYYATQTINGCESVLRKSVNVTVIPVQTITTQTVYVCTLTLLQNVIIDGLTFNHLKWYSSIDSNNVLSGATVLHSTIILYVESVNESCTSDRVTVTIETLPIVPQPSVPNVQYICGSGTVGDLAASGVSNGVIEWFSSLGSTTPLAANALLMNGTYYVSQRIGDCISSKKAVAVVVVSQTAPLLNNLEVCQGTKINDVEWYLPSGSVYEWYSSPNAQTPLTTDFVLTTGTYYIGRNTNGCKSNKTMINVTVNSIPNAPTGQSIQELAQPATINDIVMDQNNIIWFSTYNNALTQTYALSPTTYLVSGATYYGVIQNDSGCYSLPTAVTVNLFLGINDIDKSHLLVYPNPTTDKLFIEYNETIDRVEVYSILGQKIVEITNNNNNVEVDMTTLSNGTYMIKIVVGNNSQLIKAIKK